MSEYWVVFRYKRRSPSGKRHTNSHTKSEIIKSGSPSRFRSKRSPSPKRGRRPRSPDHPGGSPDRDHDQHHLPRSGSLPSILSPKVLLDEEDLDEPIQANRETSRFNFSSESKSYSPSSQKMKSSPKSSQKYEESEKSRTNGSLQTSESVNITRLSAPATAAASLPPVRRSTKFTSSAKLDISLANKPTEEEPKRTVVLQDSPSSPLPSGMLQTPLGKTYLLPRVKTQTLPRQVSSTACKYINIRGQNTRE